MRIHLYTNAHGFNQHRKGNPFHAWTKSSKNRPKDADIHVDVHESDVLDFDEILKECLVRGRDKP